MIYLKRLNSYQSSMITSTDRENGADMQRRVSHIWVSKYQPNLN